MESALKATTYTHRDPAELPVNWDAKPDYQWDEVCQVVGFDPRNNEVVWGQLSSDWNGHLKGSAVLTGQHDEQKWFAVVESGEPSRPEARDYRIHRRPLHRNGRVVAYEYAVADPTTGQIYQASPRARCRPNQRPECRRLFQEQARAWAQGVQVPWSRYLPLPQA